MAEASDSADKGSSPHTRGTRRTRSPACQATRNHPRIRGEHLQQLPEPARGDGIIPAHAGSTAIGWARDYASEGSFPHMRGARDMGELGEREGRIIPAHAGSTTSRTPLPCSAWDHPRTCGEHQRELPRLHVPVGIIPAHAGSTKAVDALADRSQGSSLHMRGARRSMPRRAGPWRDHPRTCGEHHIHDGVGQQPAGIIPAYAGSTQNSLLLSRNFQGSSPHTRGAR